MSEGPNAPHDSPLSSESLSMLQSAAKPRAMSLAERKVAAQTVAKIAATPVAVVGAMTAAKLTLATVATVGAAAMLARSIPANTERATQPQAPIAAPAASTPVLSAPARAQRTVAEPPQRTVAQPTVAQPTVSARPATTVVRHTNSSPATTVLPPSAPVVVRAAVEQPAVVQPAIAPPVRESTPTPLAVAQPTALAGTIGGSHSLSGGTLSEPPEQRETAALEQVFTVVASDPSRAMSMLDAFDREFPRGRLRDEREFLGVLALDRLGRHDEARTRARALLQRSPSGIYAPRLRRLLEQAP
ncbi:MAG: hypothetical protein U0269_18890 [Polyangiales bacterium]